MTYETQGQRGFEAVSESSTHSQTSSFRDEGMQNPDTTITSRAYRASRFISIRRDLNLQQCTDMHFSYLVQKTSSSAGSYFETTHHYIMDHATGSKSVARTYPRK